MTPATKHIFKLKYGDPYHWDYIDLTDSDHGRSDYVPGTPAEGDEDLTESGIWRVAGSTQATLVAAVELIENVLRMAANYDQDQIGACQVFLTYQEEGSEEIWESPIYEGRLELPKNALGNAWSHLVEYVTLIWRRAPWWERFDSILQMSNGNGQDSGILKVSNCNDGSGSSPNVKCNYVDIAADQVTGDLPAPVIISLSDASSTNLIGDVIVCHNVNANPASLVYHAEVGTAGDTGDSSRSGGYYKTVSVPAGSTGYDLETGSINLANVKGGAWLRFILSAKFNGTLKVTPYLKINTNKYYGPSSIITSAGFVFELFDLGMIRLPKSWLSSINQFYLLAAGINLYSAGGLSVSIDYFQYPPADSYLRAITDSQVDIFTHSFVISTKDQWVCSATYTDNKLVTTGVLYGGVYLEPGKAQRLVFKFRTGIEDNMAKMITVAVGAYMRKKTL